MAGLLNQQMNAQPTEQPEQNRNEQAAQSYQMLMEQVGNLVYNEQTVAAIKQTFDNPDLPQDQSVGLIVSNLVGAVLAKAGEKLPPTILMRMTLEVLTMVMELAVEGQYISQEEADNASKAAFFMAMERIGKRSGGMSPEYKQKVGQLIEGMGGLA